MQRAPRWAVLLARLDRDLKRLSVLVNVFTEELICARTPPQARAGLTSAMFSRLDWYYSPGGILHEHGLFSWEPAAFEAVGIRAGNVVLVCAAGGGREIDALLARGVGARGFDPSDLADHRTGQDIDKGTYDDLVAAIDGRPSPLATLAAETFDAVILGWGSFNHVLTRADQLALLAALRSRWPEAGVLLSYQTEREERTTEPPRVVALRRRIRSRLGTDRRNPGIEYLSTGGFMTFPSHESVASVAREAGYQVTLAAGPYAHDVLKPDRATTA